MSRCVGGSLPNMNKLVRLRYYTHLTLRGGAADAGFEVREPVAIT